MGQTNVQGFSVRTGERIALLVPTEREALVVEDVM
jgi:hypothetical protein